MTMIERPSVPREHGAWGMLLVPFGTALGVAGAFDLKTALLLASTLFFYVARASWLKQQWSWTALLLAASLAAALPLFVVWKLWWLVAFSGVAAVLAAQPTRRHLLMQLTATVGLVLTAPAAWYTATGRLDATAFWLWLWNGLYFVGGLLYVRMRLAPVTARCGLRWLVLGFFAGLSLFVLALVMANVFSYHLLLAFAPAVTRAAAGVGRLAWPLRIKVLGWSEVAFSVLFGVLLVAALR